MTIQLELHSGETPAPGVPDAAAAQPHGLSIRADAVTRSIHERGRGMATLLDSVSLTIAPGELVAIVGPSGAGKTTLLEALAGVSTISGGSVRFDGIDVHGNPGEFRGVIGYVPQDDTLHLELPMRHSLRYAARLRLPSGTRAHDVDRAVDAAVATVGLSHQTHVRVGALSGGQRKRASIAAELLTDPRVFFLDEPTSGLDPSTSAELVAHLRTLADRSATVVFTTHSVEDLERCDRVVFMARGGRVGFVGDVPAAFEHFGVDSVSQLFRRLSDPDVAVDSVSTAGRSTEPRDGAAMQFARRPVAGAFTQWRVLTRRTAETFVRNPLTLAILIASPVLVVSMFVILFRPGAFDFDDPSPSSMVMVGFWIVFAAFFFGITYGLLQICTERTILDRERLVGLRVGPYVASKVTVLVPFLLFVIVSMLGVLRLLDRLPSRPLTTYASLTGTLLLCAVAALGLGLLASASVKTVAQATLALPMLCFPAVLFSGAILPVHLMPGAGALVSAGIPTRWAFEAIGHDLGARRILADGGSPLGPPLLESYGDAGTASTLTYCLVLTAFVVAFMVATTAVLARTTRSSTR
jgi:ABC-type multidrug transport system ATPase subunit